VPAAAPEFGYLQVSVPPILKYLGCEVTNKLTKNQKNNVKKLFFEKFGFGLKPLIYQSVSVCPPAKGQKSYISR
jgi:hypothetical protein